jgi:hypothetical protein
MAEQVVMRLRQLLFGRQEKEDHSGDIEGLSPVWNAAAAVTPAPSAVIMDNANNNNISIGSILDVLQGIRLRHGNTTVGI